MAIKCELGQVKLKFLAISLFAFVVAAEAQNVSIDILFVLVLPQGQASNTMHLAAGSKGAGAQERHSSQPSWAEPRVDSMLSFSLS